MAKFVLKMGGHVQNEPDGVDAEGKPKFKETVYVCAKPGTTKPTIVESDEDLQARHGFDKFERYERPGPMRIPPRPAKELATREEYEIWLDSLTVEQLRLHAEEREIDATGTKEELLARIKEQ